MPTSTFFHLPEEKREKLMKAIREEFSNAPFDRVSINKIVQSAGIPRGSFYQYFTGKDDVVEYLLLGYRREAAEFVRGSLRRNGGDIFALFEDLLDFTVEFVTREQNNSFCRNLFADIKANSEIYRRRMRAADRMPFEELLPLVDRGLLDLRRESDLADMISVLETVYRDAVTEIFLNLQDRERVREGYRRRLGLLRRGFMKNKELTNADA